MAGRFTSFVVFAEMRTGSNYLEANLNALPGVACLGELFNPHFIGRLNQTEFLGWSMAQREADPLGFLADVRRQTGGLVGFRFFHDHDPRLPEVLLGDPACAKIVLRRNPLESYVSWKIAQETGQWKLTNAKALRSARVRFDPPEFEAMLAAQAAFQHEIRHALQVTGQAAFALDYEDIRDTGVLAGLAAFLGVEGAPVAPDQTLKKQNPEDLTRKVVNPEEMAAALARIDRFGLGHSPDFEPARGAAIPQVLAARGAALLFLPLRGGPEAQVADWLARLGPPGGETGVETGFTQKTLRQWRRARPGHRSFTVLRHPLDRAHHAFCELILTGRLAEIRATLIRLYKLRLPDPGEMPDEAQHREGFLGFLRFLKLNLAGQTGLRIDPHWASQSAVLQGFARGQAPDALLREDRLAEGLAWLATEVGVASPPLPPAPQPQGPALAAIYDAALEEAAREAYGRDYVGFGFADWRDDKGRD